MNLLTLQTVTDTYQLRVYSLAGVAREYARERPRVIKPFGVLVVRMALNQTVGANLSAVELPVLQLGGGLIELAVLFLILALVAGVLGARGVAGLSMDIAKWLVIIFIVLAVVTFLL